jgi:hypothetical protein
MQKGSMRLLYTGEGSGAAVSRGEATLEWRPAMKALMVVGGR